MIIKEAGLKACRRTLQNTFHKNKIWFYKLKEKPALTPDDIVSRLAWAGDHMKIKKDACVSLVLKSGRYDAISCVVSIWWLPKTVSHLLLKVF